jgi:hypothetical protein
LQKNHKKGTTKQLQITKVPSSRIPIETTTTTTKDESYYWIYVDPKTSQKQEAKEKEKNSLKFSCVEEQKLNSHGPHGFSKGSLQEAEQVQEQESN